MKVTEFLRVYSTECRKQAGIQDNKESCRRLHHVADVYTKMLNDWFANGDAHKDLPGKLIGRVKHFINEHPNDLDIAIKASVSSLIISTVEKGGE